MRHLSPSTPSAGAPSGWQDLWPAPAKLNLFLHVVGRRPDGYHLLQTVFRLIDFADELRFAPRADGKVRRAHELAGIHERDDLSLRAARLLKAETGCTLGATVALQKRIPVGAGLGGGSSDAATTLMALNRLWRLDLPQTRLAELGTALGADVPFFLGGENAFAEGIGEVLTPLTLEPAWYVVVMPQVSVPTKEIFADPGLTRTTKPATIAVFFAGYGRNDLEPVVCRRYPAVARVLASLRAQGWDARMSGSGASVFAAFESETEARRAAAEIPEQVRGATTSFVVEGLPRHPLSQGAPVQLGSRQVG